MSRAGISTETRVVLSSPELYLGAHVGVRRHVESLAVNRRDAHGFRGDGWGAHLEGALGELALAKFLGVYYDGSVDRFSREGADVERFHVRTRSRIEYDLLVRPDDAPGIYVLVFGHAPVFWVRGWLSDEDARQKKYLRRHGGRPPAFFVPAIDLNDSLLLKQEKERMDFHCNNTGGNWPHAYGRKIEDGSYTGFVQAAKETTSKKGGPMLALTVGIDEQPDGRTPDGGVKIDCYVVPSYQQGVDDFVRALLPSRLEEWEASGRKVLGNVVVEDVVGLDVDVLVYHEEYQGKLRANVRLLPAPGVPAGE